MLWCGSRGHVPAKECPLQVYHLQTFGISLLRVPSFVCEEDGSVVPLLETEEHMVEIFGSRIQ